MATTLFGATWIGDEEPTVGVVACQDWRRPTSGEHWMRNTSNTAWGYWGNVNEERGGSAALSGAAFTGPVTAPDVPPETNPDFFGTARQNGIPLALQTALSSMERRLYDRLGFLVEQRYLSQSRRSGIAASIAFDAIVTEITHANLYANGVTVPLPIFESDGVSATWDQVDMYCAIPLGMCWFDSVVGSATSCSVRLAETAEGSHVFKPIGVGSGAYPTDTGLFWNILTLAHAVR